MEVKVVIQYKYVEIMQNVFFIIDLLFNGPSAEVSLALKCITHGQKLFIKASLLNYVYFLFNIGLPFLSFFKTTPF